MQSDLAGLLLTWFVAFVCVLCVWAFGLTLHALARPILRWLVQRVTPTRPEEGAER